MGTRFAFLTSNRFWAIILASLGSLLVDPAFPTQPWYVSLGKFLVLSGTGFTAVRTIDRHADKQVEAATAVASSTVEQWPVVEK